MLWSREEEAVASRVPLQPATPPHAGCLLGSYSLFRGMGPTIVNVPLVWSSASCKHMGVPPLPLCLAPLPPSGVTVHPDGAILSLRAGPQGPPAQASPSSAAPPALTYGSRLQAKLVLDCMGHASPIVRQLRCGRMRAWARGCVGACVDCSGLGEHGT